MFGAKASSTISASAQVVLNTQGFSRGSNTTMAWDAECTPGCDGVLNPGSCIDSAMHGVVAMYTLVLNQLLQLAYYVAASTAK